MIEDFQTSCRALNAARDRNLGRYFVRTPYIERLLGFTNEECIAVGLKGIGKTAAFRILTEFDKSADTVVALSSATHIVHVPSLDLNFNICRKQFELDLVIDALRAIVENKTLHNRIPGLFLKDAKKVVKSYRDLIKKHSKRVVGVGVSVLGCGFNVQLAAPALVLAGMKRTNELQAAEGILEHICDSGLKVRIVIDDPELVFSATRSIDAQLIGGLCLAALRISELSKNLKVICLIKSHVYYPVSKEVEDLSHYPRHHARLSWDEDTLAELLYRRLEVTVPKEPRQSGRSKLWNQLFVAAPGNTSETSPSILKHMISQVRNGPRDLLHWVDLCIDRAKNSRQAKVGRREVVASFRDLSVHSLSEMERAHSLHYPKLADVLSTVFRTEAKTKFGLAEFRAYLADLLVNNDELRKLWMLPWMQQETSTTLPERLFEAGAVNFERAGKEVRPYEAAYRLENLHTADVVYLSPLLIPAVTE